jgi:hypothetical protein
VTEERELPQVFSGVTIVDEKHFAGAAKELKCCLL